MTLWNPANFVPPDDDTRILSWQGGATVVVIDEAIVFKEGGRVHYREEAAMRLVKQYTDVPVPEIFMSSYGPSKGSIGMSYIPDTQLKLVWDGLDQPTKERICRMTWDMIQKIRQIPRPESQRHLFQCSADGTPSEDVLIKDLQNPPRPILDDESLRKRIYDRYIYYNGRLHAETLPSMLPRSNVSVFTHGDIAPRNILVDKSGRVTGIFDWELAGWYPDYWEYVNVMKPSTDQDWQQWMDRTAPQKWDISAIQAARRVLF